MASSSGQPVSPETYWRRRVVVLAAVLVVVALVAWACQAQSSSGDGEQQASVDPGSEEDGEGDEGSEDEESPEEDEDTADAEDEENGDSDGDGDGGGSGGSGGGSGGDGEAAPDIPAPRQASDPCRPQDIVVTAEADESDYASGEEPTFSLSVVNLGEQTCTVDVGPATMELVVKSGDDRVFSTADCVDNGSRNEELEQGRPLTTTVTWDRKRSWEDCRDDDKNAGSGTYQAELHSIYDNGAEPVVFRLK
ncbi:hypothetical protein J4H86_19240 [Spiractinospora alimapuensis]|uniref:hypothetical protein n=1 Tax=Spiractinospora alimapuensis TaxID=2820884 RepID=UPI001F2689DE|nr:hypothetical protein [Spiractinospora alimapuensis]QVQ50967.1 hypothetical protein J4H86_19240 [Spiractinospora alimapuensis]